MEAIRIQNDVINATVLRVSEDYDVRVQLGTEEVI